ncbi:MAG: hypothetical protein OXE83_08145 [Gammaproteobacteria bacterium]|nr:hypothetical protein [Gammaproteobacteria bacterium]
MPNPLRDESPVIYCLESVWRHDEDDKDLRSRDSTVEPLLQFLEVNGYWDYRHRDVATRGELKYYLANEWCRCSYGSILYVCTHGSPGSITLSDQQHIDFEELALDLADACEGCHVHLGGCAVLNIEASKLESFKRATGAAVVSGFKKDNIGWTDLKLPGVLAELMLFSALSGVNYSDGRKYGRRLKSIKEKMEERFEDCDFAYI